MFHLNLIYFTVLLLYCPYLTRQHQQSIQGNRGIKRSGLQYEVSYANFAVHKLHQLQGSLLDSSREVIQSKECALACVNSYNPPCFSLNIAVLPNENGKLRCELLSEDKFRSPNKLTASQHFHHYSIKTPCSKNPCKNNGTCIPNYEEDNYDCVCLPGYTGDHCKTECLSPLGMENYKITPAQISASSQLSGQYSPNQGRLHVKFDGGIGSSWIAGANNLHQWFQIDLRITTNVTFVATQGRDGINQWVTKFKLQYSNDSISFNAYKQQGENTDKVFVGNNDSDTVVRHGLIPPIKARYIRLLPTEWNAYISMRMELYGCFEDMKPLGMESGAITDSQITVSSALNDIYSGATRARLHTRDIDIHARGAWIPATNDLNQWLQVDLSEITAVTHVATQGRNSYSPVQMVTKYKLQFSDDGASFLFYKREGESSDAVFDGNFDHDTIVYHQLNPTITARSIRIRPTVWQAYIAMRMELYTYGGDA